MATSEPRPENAFVITLMIPASISLPQKRGRLRLTQSPVRESWNNLKRTSRFSINRHLLCYRGPGGTIAFRAGRVYSRKVEFLVNNGYEIGNHSYWHENLGKVET